MSDGHPLFAFVFHDGVGQALQDFASADVAAGNADFIWLHLDLRDPAAQAWLRRRPWPPEVIEVAAAPIQRGRLFTTPDLIYGHVRDFRDESGAVALEAGSLCIVAGKTTLVRHGSHGGRWICSENFWNPGQNCAPKSWRSQAGTWRAS